MELVFSVERYPNEAAARSAVTVLLAEVNSEKTRIRTRSVTVAQLCDHFEQRENSRRTTLGAVTRRRKRTRHICTDGFVRTGGTMNWLRSEQYRLKVGFDACLWRRAVAPRFEI